MTRRTDSLFVPLAGAPWAAFNTGVKTVEVRQDAPRWDLNEACGVLSAVDEDKHYVDLAAKLEMLAARWMFYKLDGGAERKEQVVAAIENLVGWRISVFPTDSADWPRYRLEQRLREHQRQASEIRKTLAALPKRSKPGVVR